MLCILWLLFCFTVYAQQIAGGSQVVDYVKPLFVYPPPTTQTEN
jgi:hypothetical protein